MAHHRDHEEEWIDEVEHRSEGFVIDQGEREFESLAIDDEEAVTFRRAHFATSFVTGQLEVMESFPKSAASDIAFTSGVELHDEVEDEEGALGFEPFQMPLSKPQPVELTLSASSAFSSYSETEVPELPTVTYHRVNPSFESKEAPQVIMNTVQHALRALEVEFHTQSPWHMEAFAVVAAEEVFLIIQLFRVPSTGHYVVDFNLKRGDETQFLMLTERIRRECKSIDSEMMNLCDLSFDIMADWASSDGLFPRNNTADDHELSLLIEEIQSAGHPFARYEVAKQIKDFCQYPQNRWAFCQQLKEPFMSCLHSMLEDENEDIVRYAIFVILSFASDAQISLQSFDMPELPRMLQRILQVSQKPSTKKLAGDLYRTLQAVY